ncbi:MULTISPECIES: hypothetical protein [unclassified Paenibacillus]|uniref:hypothetical protein n=1 Tax=unclassified Paenibacillus TaxID=185978 RepID=UPI001AE97A10|nr:MULTISPECIES: hypothetical protein [unclassified Paenibacillus]MBP1154241.1 hypothetical protein [Paenibacillus sp. PvP091]MBP1170374.1 hypothetical protein [Paenibacillus sp. PvR098]MBP2441402.1 hypothetical protein [Paenibacillus sp. PvP052]
MPEGPEPGIPEDNVKILWNQFFVLRQQIENVKKENMQLEKEWNEKKQQVKPSVSAHVYKDLILKKTKDAVVLLNQQKEAELERVRAEFAARKAEQEERARKIDEELQMVQNLLKIMLDELERVVLHQFDDGMPPDMSTPVEERPPQESHPQLEIPAEEPKQQPETLSGFWDNIDEYLGELNDRSHTGGHGVDEAAPKPKEHLIDSGFPWERSEPGMLPQTVIAEPLTAAASDISGRGSKVVPLKPQASQENRSAVFPLTEEIELIKNQYIVGNKAGEDIYDRNGQIIVSKNSVITSDVVTKAEAEGKMADLIVQMILPGFGDQEHE